MKTRMIFLWGFPILIVGLVISCTILELAFQGVRQAGWTTDIEDNSTLQAFVEWEGTRFILIHLSLVVLTVFVSIWLFLLARYNRPEAADEQARVGWRFWLQWTCANTAGPAVSYLALIPLFLLTLTFTISVLPTLVPEIISAPSAVTIRTILILIGPGVVSGIVGAAASGVMQWLALRQYVPRAGWWISVSAAALTVSYALTVAFTEFLLYGGLMIMTLDDVSAGIIFIVIFGAIWTVPGVTAIGIIGGASSIVQWLIMRHHSSRVKWLGLGSWPLAGSVGLTIGSIASGIGITAACVGASISYYNAFLLTSLVLLIGGPLGIAAGGVVGGASTGGVLTWLLQPPAAEIPDSEVGKPSSN